MPRAKYGNRKHRGYDSRKEARRAEELAWMEQAGEIRDLQHQVKFQLLPKQDGERPIDYTADFVYYDNQGNRVVEDCKGFRTPVYRIKRKLMLWFHGIRILET